VSSEYNQALYNVIAARLVWDKQFFIQLRRDPEGAIEATLDEAKVAYTEEDLANLMEHYNEFIKSNPPHALTTKSMQLLGGEEMTIDTI
jgi:hypothetical protein